MKIFLTLMLFVSCLISQSFMQLTRVPTLYPIFDPTGIDLPRNLRTTQQQEGVKNSELNIKGLNELKASGSGQFSEKNFIELLYRLPTTPRQLIILDLRQESHGFINGQPVSWTDGNYNYGNLNKNLFEIESDEFQRLRLVAQAKRLIVNPSGNSTKLAVHMVKTERDIVQHHGVSYLRLPVTDHNRPSDDIIDQFVDFVKKVPSDQWLHFHCKAGKGRTTVFLTLLDIMKNGHQVSLNDILIRQQLIGGTDLQATTAKEGEKKRAAVERLDFIKQFYDYCLQVPDFRVNWSTWIRQPKSISVNP